LQLGSSLRNVGRAEEAVSPLGDAEMRYRKIPSVSMFLAVALHSRGQPSEALRIAFQAMLMHLNSKDVERYRPALENYIRQIGQ